MTKAEFINHVKALYRVGNMSDSDNPARPEWVKPVMAGEACCAQLDKMLFAMLEAGILTSDEHAEIYDTL